MCYLFIFSFFFFFLPPLSLVVISLSGSIIICCINYKISSINIISFKNSFKKFRVVNNSFSHEIDYNILGGGSHFLKVVALNCKFVFKLSFSFQKICVVTVIKIFLVCREWSELVVFDPRGEPVSGQRIGFYFGNFSSSQKPKPSYFVLQRTQVPKTRDPKEIYCNQIHIYPFPRPV